MLLMYARAGLVGSVFGVKCRTPILCGKVCQCSWCHSQCIVPGFVMLFNMLTDKLCDGFIWLWCGYLKIFTLQRIDCIKYVSLYIYTIYIACVSDDIGVLCMWSIPYTLLVTPWTDYVDLFMYMIYEGSTDWWCAGIQQLIWGLPALHVQQLCGFRRKFMFIIHLEARASSQHQRTKHNHCPCWRTINHI